jgi:hypothetical protein
MEENLRWVWYAFGIAWGLHAAYAVSLSLRQKQLTRSIEDLHKLIKEQRGKLSSAEPGAATFAHSRKIFVSRNRRMVFPWQPTRVNR